MYARSYDTHTGEEGAARALPSGYSGIAFENEAIEPSPQPHAPCEPCAPQEEEQTAAAGLFSPPHGRIPFLDKLKFPALQGLSLGTLFSDTEDFLLIGLFLLLLLSKEGDPLCAVAVAVLFFSGKF